MGQQSNMPRVEVVGKKFCAPRPVDLTIVQNMNIFRTGNFSITDTNGNIMFKVRSKFFLIFGDRRILFDASGYPIISLQRKIINLHSRWKVYRGDSRDSKDLLFTVEKSSLFQFKTKLDVFLASNTNGDNRDFKIKSSLFDKTCTIYAGNSCAIIAKMHRKQSFSSVFLGKNKYAVTVYPHVDYAFIVSLVVILAAVNSERRAR